MLEEDRTLSTITHVLIDEVHERTVEGDFLMLTLRDLLAEGRPSGLPPLHICLMSATMDSSALSNYFGDCPRVQVAGRAFPVTTLYLEHALLLTKHVVRSEMDWALGSRMAEKRKQQQIERLTEGESPPPPHPTEAEWARRLPHAPGACRALAILDPSAVNVALICELLIWFKSCGGVDAALEKVCGSGGSRRSGGGGNLGGACLVFLPGVKEIQDVREALLQSSAFGGDEEQREWVLPLHGGLSPDEQRRVFERPAAQGGTGGLGAVCGGSCVSASGRSGVIKVVLATNVAETSITIDDVGFVIDSGRVKEERYEVARRMASLQDVLVSKAAAKQRRGRAGRVQHGLCVHLFPSDAPLEPYTAPEVCRVALEQLVMRTKALKLPGKAVDSISRLPDPPARDAVAAAVAELSSLGALDLDEELSPMGRLLARLPIDARLGKLILLGVAFQATDEALTVAAALASRTPFLSPMERRAEADESRRLFATFDSHAFQSDHLALLSAYEQFDSRSGDAKFSFARERFLGVKTLAAIGSLKRQLLEALSLAGLAPPGLQASRVEDSGRRRGGCDGVRGALGDPPPPPQELFCSILAAALHLAYVAVQPGSNAGSHVSYLIRDAKGESTEPSVAQLHPSSVNSRLARSDGLAPYIAFHECVLTTKLYIRDSSPAPLLPLLLFGGAHLRQADPNMSLAVAATHGGVELLVDGWLSVKVQPPRAANLVLEMRRRIDALMQRLLQRASNSAGAHHERGMAAGPSWVAGAEADVSGVPDLIGAVVALFKIEAQSEVAKKSKSKGKSKKGRGGGGGCGDGGPSCQESIFNDPYNDAGGRGGLYEF
jgi:ATP-dependent RNA helicase DHX57